MRPRPSQCLAGSRSAERPRFKFSLAIMGGSSRGGNWVVPKRYLAFAIMGG